MMTYEPTEGEQNVTRNYYNKEGIYGDFIIRYQVAPRGGVGWVQVCAYFNSILIQFNLFPL